MKFINIINYVLNSNSPTERISDQIGEKKSPVENQGFLLFVYGKFLFKEMSFCKADRCNISSIWKVIYRNM